MVERRRYERVNLFCRVTVSSSDGGRTVEGNTLDISLGGVGVITVASYAVGDNVAVTFHLSDERGRESPCRVFGRVASLRADTEANRIGIEFLEPLREAAQPLLVRKILKA